MNHRFVCAILALVPALPAAGAERLDGAWLFDAATIRGNSQVGRFWTAQVRVTGNSFVVSRFMGLSKELTGQIVLDPAASPRSIDLKLAEYDLGAAGAGVKMKIPAGALAGIYKLDGDRLTMCLSIEIDGPRPKSFDSVGDKVALITLVKAPAGFKEFPKNVAVTVVGADGKPAAGVTLAQFMSLRENRNDKTAKRDWQYYKTVKTGTDGVAKVPFEDFGGVIARDASKHLMAFPDVSPARLASGTLRVTLQPECRVTGTLVCPEKEKLAMPLGWTNVYLFANDQRVADCDSSEGKFEFVVPPGNYKLNAYGSDLRGHDVSITIAAGHSELTVEPISLKASAFVLLQGRPAPELTGVLGWKGKPLKLADLKDKYVLLEFTGYWCGPCMHSMPVLIELHEKYADRGLAIVGVHVDTDGEVATVEQLDEKLAEIRKSLWKGKDVPFPVALTSGKQVGEGDDRSRGLAAAQYGVTKYPTAILIDRDGKVVREFHARDAKSAGEEIEKLLNDKK